MSLKSNLVNPVRLAKKVLKRHLSPQLIDSIRSSASPVTLLSDYFYDAYRFFRSKNGKASVKDMDQERAAMHLMRLMHSLEKGLALPNPAPGFGKVKAVNLKSEADAYCLKFGIDEVYRLCLKVLLVHQRFQEQVNGDHAHLVAADLEMASSGVSAGSRKVTRDEIWAKSKIDFDSFCKARFSARVFTGEVVCEADIVDAIRMAMKSPSVCNRGCGRAYYSVDKDLIDRALSMQGGNRGFGHLAGGVIVVAADMRAFYKTGERNQGWVDGGLFAMSLNYALHSKGYGVCMLNWSKDARQDLKFRGEFGIPKEHIVVMLMVVGHLPEELDVAVSPRRDIGAFAIKMH